MIVLVWWCCHMYPPLQGCGQRVPRCSSHHWRFAAGLPAAEFTLLSSHCACGGVVLPRPAAAGEWRAAAPAPRSLVRRCKSRRCHQEVQTRPILAQFAHPLARAHACRVRVSALPSSRCCRGRRRATCKAPAQARAARCACARRPPEPFDAGVTARCRARAQRPLLLCAAPAGRPGIRGGHASSQTRPLASCGRACLIGAGARLIENGSQLAQ